MRISRFISSAVCVSLLLMAQPAMAQQKGEAAATVNEDSIPLFRGVAVSADLVGIVQKAVGSYGQIEGAVRVNLKDKYYPVVEIGLGKADANDVTTHLSYKTSAPYGRIGADFNVLKNKHDDYRLLVGGRYAFTSFKYNASAHDIVDPVWGGEALYRIHDEKANCHWLEAVVGVDVKLWRFVRLGWSGRYKLRLAHDDGHAGNVWYVPGFGKQGSTRLGGTFNVTFEL